MKIISLFDYHKYWLSYRDRIRNDHFDAISDRILDFKNGKADAIEFFADVISGIYTPAWDGYHCALVPSHDPLTVRTPMHQVVEDLCRRHKVWNDAGALRRVRKIQKLSCGGNRSVEVHIGSIRIAPESRIYGRNYLLFDDVRTTGNSLTACGKILRNAGAKEVIAIVLGTTVDEYAYRSRCG